LHVKRDFSSPAGVDFRMTLWSRLGQHAASRAGQTERGVENVQVLEDVGVIVSVDDGDGLTRAVALHAAESNLIKPISLPDLSGRVTDRIRIGDAVPSAIRQGEDAVQTAGGKEEPRFQFFNSQ